MKKIILVLTVVTATFISCAMTGAYSATGAGSIFTSITEPVSNSAAATGNKKGEACNSNILGLFATGDGSIIAARQNGGITKVATVDRKILNVLFLFGQTCTIVTGE